MSEGETEREKGDWEVKLRELETLSPDQKECVKIACDALAKNDSAGGVRRLRGFLRRQGWELTIEDKHFRTANINLTNAESFSRDPEHPGIKIVRPVVGSYPLLDNTDVVAAIVHEFLFGTTCRQAKSLPEEEGVEYFYERVRDISEAEKEVFSKIREEWKREPFLRRVRKNELLAGDRAEGLSRAREYLRSK